MLCGQVTELVRSCIAGIGGVPNAGTFWELIPSELSGPQ